MKPSLPILYMPTLATVVTLGTITATSAGGATIIKPFHATQRGHQFQWESPREIVRAKDQKSDVFFEFRKGDNSFMERGFVFVRVGVRAERLTHNGTFEFEIYNYGNMQRVKQIIDFNVKTKDTSGQIVWQEQPGAYWIVPGNFEEMQKPNVWSNTSFTVDGVRMKRLTVTKD